MGYFFTWKSLDISAFFQDEVVLKNLTSSCNIYRDRKPDLFKTSKLTHKLESTFLLLCRPMVVFYPSPRNFSRS
ncbi:MAG: hypothetical protein WBA93_00840 [Microcoleaceae cyanobacterium]